jgi:hypothetical protein
LGASEFGVHGIDCVDVASRWLPCSGRVADEGRESFVFLDGVGCDDGGGKLDDGAAKSVNGVGRVVV